VSIELETLLSLFRFIRATATTSIRYLGTCPKNFVFPKTFLRFRVRLELGLGLKIRVSIRVKVRVRVSGNTFSVKRPFEQVSYKIPSRHVQHSTNLQITFSPQYSGETRFLLKNKSINGGRWIFPSGLFVLL